MMKFIFSLIFVLGTACNPAYAIEKIIPGPNAQVEGIQTDKNFIGGKGHFETPSSFTGWTAYADAAGTSPVDGIGGSPSVTCTRNTGSLINGIGSLLITKGAANRQGEGCSLAFTIDKGARGKVIRIGFDYLVNSGTYADGDLRVYVFDVTNSRMIEPAPTEIKNVSGTGNQQTMEFQASSDSVSYRLIYHVASTSSAAYTVANDDIKVGRMNIARGPPVTDWQSYSLTIGAVTTAPTPGIGATSQARWRRVGDTLEILYVYYQTAAGSPGSGVYKFPIPSGLTIDTSKVSVQTNVAAQWASSIVGSAQLSANATASASHSLSQVYVFDSTNLYIANGTGSAGTVDPVSSGQSSLSNNPQSYSFFARVPIVGWSSGTTMAADAGASLISATASGTAATVTSGNPVIFPTVSQDTGGNYNSSTGKFTCAGAWTVRISYAIASTIGNGTKFSIYKNAVAGDDIGYAYNDRSNGSGKVTCVAGDLLDVRPNGNLTSTGTGQISFERINNVFYPQSNEKLVASYTASAARTTSTTTPYNFDTKVVDNLGTVTTGSGWKFTAPYAGTFSVKVGVQYTNGTADVAIYKNGSLHRYLFSINTTANNMRYNGSIDVELLTGDYIDIRSGASATFDNNASANWITISSVK